MEKAASHLHVRLDQQIGVADILELLRTYVGYLAREGWAGSGLLELQNAYYPVAITHNASREILASEYILPPMPDRVAVTYKNQITRIFLLRGRAVHSFFKDMLNLLSDHLHDQGRYRHAMDMSKLAGVFHRRAAGVRYRA